MKEYKNGSIEIKYKDALDYVEYKTLIDMSIDGYKNGSSGELDDLGIVTYNPLTAERLFYKVLMSICIEDYDDKNFNDYFKEGVHKMLISEVANAEDAWVSVYDILTEASNVGNVLNNQLNKLMVILDKNMPDYKEMEKMMKKLPKTLSKSISEYNSIFEKKSE